MTKISDFLVVDYNCAYMKLVDVRLAILCTDLEGLSQRNLEQKHTVNISSFRRIKIKILPCLFANVVCNGYPICGLHICMILPH